MRGSWRLAVLTLVLVALTVPVRAAEPTPVSAVCGATTSQLPGEVVPTPLFASNFLCGTCSGTCSGLFTADPCFDASGAGVCIGLVSGSGAPLRCTRPDTGNRCYCAVADPM